MIILKAGNKRKENEYHQSHVKSFKKKSYSKSNYNLTFENKIFSSEHKSPNTECPPKTTSLSCEYQSSYFNAAN